MKILVPITKVPDTTSKIAFTDNSTKFSNDGVTFIMNPTDEWYALTRAIELKEANAGSEVVVINVGAADNEQIIRKALAIGADRAVRVDAEPTDAFFVASQIAAYAQTEKFDLIVTGKETIDFNSFQVGGMVAELLDLPAVALASKLEVAGNTATVTREIEGGTETVEASLPLVVCASKDLAQARIPNMKGIMAARTKPLQVVPATAVENRTNIVSFALPEKAKQAKMVSPDNVAELVRLLHEEAKVI
ncbi:MAG: electron transfer flavoprotein subunit beta/FixA family protein [Chitinophagales bacterium]